MEFLALELEVEVATLAWEQVPGLEQEPELALVLALVLALALVLVLVLVLSAHLLECF